MVRRWFLANKNSWLPEWSLRDLEYRAAGFWSEAELPVSDGVLSVIRLSSRYCWHYPLYCQNSSTWDGSNQRQLNSNWAPTETQLSSNWATTELQLSSNWVPTEFQLSYNWTPTEPQLSSNWATTELQLSSNWTPLQCATTEFQLLDATDSNWIPLQRATTEFHCSTTLLMMSCTKIIFLLSRAVR